MVEPAVAPDGDDIEAQMQAMMGIGGFGTTKQKKVKGNDVGAISKNSTTKYRQYMYAPPSLLVNVTITNSGVGIVRADLIGRCRHRRWVTGEINLPASRRFPMPRVVFFSRYVFCGV